MLRQVIDSEGNKSFDARVHRKDAKGLLSNVMPYTLECLGDRQYFYCHKAKALFYGDGTLVPADQIPAELAKKYAAKVAAPAQAAKPAAPVPAKPVTPVTPTAPVAGVVKRGPGRPAAPKAAAPAALVLTPAEMPEANPEPEAADPAAEGKAEIPAGL